MGVSAFFQRLFRHFFTLAPVGKAGPCGLAAQEYHVDGLVEPTWGLPIVGKWGVGRSRLDVICLYIKL